MQRKVFGIIERKVVTLFRLTFGASPTDVHSERSIAIFY